MEENSISDPPLSESDGSREPLWSPPQTSLLQIFAMTTYVAVALFVLLTFGAAMAIYLAVYSIVIDLTLPVTEKCSKSTRIRAVAYETLLFLIILGLAIIRFPSSQ